MVLQVIKILRCSIHATIGKRQRTDANVCYCLQTNWRIECRSSFARVKVYYKCFFFKFKFGFLHLRKNLLKMFLFKFKCGSLRSHKNILQMFLFKFKRGLLRSHKNLSQMFLFKFKRGSLRSHKDLLQMFLFKFKCGLLAATLIFFSFLKII